MDLADLGNALIAFSPVALVGAVALFVTLFLLRDAPRKLEQ